MANIQRNFIRGRMNKSLDERLVPNGEYVDALNVRLGSTEETEIGAVENSKGNLPLTTLQYIDGTALSADAKCIGAFEDGANLAIYWFVHDPSFTQGATGKLDLVVSFDVETGELIYHVISIDNGDGIDTTLNFNPNYLVTGVDKIDNLLFFTDNYNPPRVVNINHNYGDPASGTDLDAFNQDDILVIKKPPTSAPTIELFNEPDLTDAYLEDKFVCFAYRYKYDNDEYSALSQFTSPAFSPGAFNFSGNSYLNEGMVNIFNAAKITFDTGSSKAKEIQIVFKEANSTVIKVLENFNKKQQGYTDNSSETIEFSNRKIYTVLPSSEILRLYDNVPQVAKAQTLMGNRLMYGNYKEGYDLTSSDVECCAPSCTGDKVNFQFTSSLLTDDINYLDVGDQAIQGAEYTINLPPAVAAPDVSIDDSELRINLSALVPNITTNPQGYLKIGTTLTFTFNIGYSASYTPSSPAPVVFTDILTLTWSYTLIADYLTVTALVTSTDFQEKIGVASTIETVANAADGRTLTDAFNAVLPVSFDSTYDTLVQTGRTASTPLAPLAGEPLEIIEPSFEYSPTFGIQLNAAIYDKGSSVDPMLAYWRFSSAAVTARSLPTVSSLHSNRGYEIGMVYMDDFNRASTAQVSQASSAVNVDCSYSNTKNYIQVEIPSGVPAQLPPVWATKYKFVIKPTEGNYETIFSNVVYSEPGTTASYFLLEGENANKVEAGDRLIVKADATGPLRNCTYATVLEKENKETGFLDMYDDAGDDLDVFGGTFMKINANNFMTDTTADTQIITLPLSVTADESRCGRCDSYPLIAYPMFTSTTAETTAVSRDVYTVPAGSVIKMELEFTRQGVPFDKDSQCLLKNYTLTRTFSATQDYENMQEWWEGDNIDSVLNDGAEVVADEEQIINTYIIPMNQTESGAPYSPPPLGINNPSTYTGVVSAGDIESTKYFDSTATTPNVNFYYRFYEAQTVLDANGSKLLYLLISGSSSCQNATAPHRNSTVAVNFTVSRGEVNYVFETEPAEALPDVWYENNESFDISGGCHLGNVQDQTATQPAKINTGFFNCYTFGNGVESNKIRDSIKGEQVTLGNRLFTTSNEEYKQAHRFADITYSGVFNDESNVNRLNEFNLGLLNFKPLEESYGDVEVLYARETDILVLQEDKISYVLAGKNLLTDAVGGGAVTSVPEVLGTQIARIEDFGISNHPESFAAFGENKYFSDAKRNVIVKLTGSSAQNEVLTIISNEGMRSWFRDLFAEASSTQKLGGYDPYMHEYIFTSNTIIKPETELCLACGVTKNITVVAGQEYVYCVEVGEEIGPR